MLINEYRLNLLDPKARQYLNEQMEQFLFGGGSGPEAIPNYVPPKS
jgi:Fe-S cluster protector protein